MSHADDTSAQRRSLALLWTTPETPARGPQRGLTMARIVEVAIEIADTEGLAALSMRRLANSLGVGAASLYSYLPGKAELEALMLDALAGRGTMPHELPGTWRAKFEFCAREDWQSFREHPWILQLNGAESTPGPNLLRWLDSSLQALEGTRLSEQEKMAVVESVDAYVRGLARLHLETSHSDPYQQDSEHLQERDATLGTVVDFGRYPALGEALRAGVKPYVGDQFEFGLQRLLDGIEALIVARTQPPHDLDR